MTMSQHFFTSFFACALLRLPAVLELVGDRRSQFYADMAAGLWPQPVSTSGRSVAWPAAEIAAVNAARIAGRTSDEIRALVAELVASRKDAPKLVADLYFADASTHGTRRNAGVMTLQTAGSLVKEGQ